MGARSLKDGQVEVKLRNQEERTLIPLKNLVEEIHKLKKELEEELHKNVVEIPFKVD